MRKLTSLWMVAFVFIVFASVLPHSRADDATSQPVKKDVPYVPRHNPSSIACSRWPA
jgi:hypothetical protein